MVRHFLFLMVAILNSASWLWTRPPSVWDIHGAIQHKHYHPRVFQYISPVSKSGVCTSNGAIPTVLQRFLPARNRQNNVVICLYPVYSSTQRRSGIQSARIPHQSESNVLCAFDYKSNFLHTKPFRSKLINSCMSEMFRKIELGDFYGFWRPSSFRVTPVEPRIETDKLERMSIVLNLSVFDGCTRNVCRYLRRGAARRTLIRW